MTTLTETILAMHDAGKTVPEIAKAIDRTTGQVRSALRRNGRKSHLPTGRPKKALHDATLCATLSPADDVAS